MTQTSFGQHDTWPTFAHTPRHSRTMSNPWSNFDHGSKSLVIISLAKCRLVTLAKCLPAGTGIIAFDTMQPLPLESDTVAVFMQSPQFCHFGLGCRTTRFFLDCKKEDMCFFAHCQLNIYSVENEQTVPFNIFLLQLNQPKASRT